MAIAVALLSPIATYVRFFFFMHMAQHMLLIFVAAPLLWLGAPLLPTLWSLPRVLRRGIGRWGAPGHPVRQVLGLLVHPVVATLVVIGTVATWHVPVFYDPAQGPTPIHELEHLTFLSSALLYWWLVAHPTGGRRRLSRQMAIPYLLPHSL